MISGYCQETRRTTAFTMLLRKISVVYLIHFWVEHLVEAVITTPIACSLNLSQSSLSKLIEERIEDKGSLRLLRYHFKIKNDTGPFSSANTGESSLINPYSLVLALDGEAKSFLHLKEHSVQMSLYTLSYGVAEYEGELVQWPMKCLENVSSTDLETELKLLIFRNFGASRSSVITLEGEVCNQYMKVIDDNFGVATYNCCRLDAEEQFICGDLEKNVWTNVLFVAIIILQFVLVLYCPTLVPLIRRKAEQYNIYIHNFKNNPKLRVVKINNKDPMLDEYFVKAKPFPFSTLKAFGAKMRELEENKLYNIDVKELKLFVKDEKIVADGDLPVTLFGFLKSVFFRCDKEKNIKSEIEKETLVEIDCCKNSKGDSKELSKKYEDLLDLWSCCNATTCTCPFVQGTHCRDPSWYRILSWLNKAVYLLIITSPWWFRIWFYYTVEEDSLAKQKDILSKTGLKQSYQGSLTLTLTPQHPFFISMYVCLFLLGVMIKVCLKEDDTKIDIYTTLRKSIKNIKDEKIFDSILQFIAFMLIPIKKYGIPGIIPFLFLFLPMLTIGLTVLSIIIFPMVNLTFRLLLLSVYACCRDKEISNPFCDWCQIINAKLYKWSDKSKLKYIHSRSLTTFAGALFLIWLAIGVSIIFIVESLVFYAECTIYLLIGIILNSADTFNFFVFILSLAIYTYRCFNSVGSQYQVFGKFVNKIIFKTLKDDVTKIAKESKKNQLEHAFAVPNGQDDKKALRYRTAKMIKKSIKLSLTSSSNSYLKWNAKRLLLFLDTDDIVYISRDFVMNVANLNHPYCPGHVGPVQILYLRAIRKLLWITLYLTFQFVVIATFGGSTNISSFNQTMATIVGGFLPYIVTQYFKKKNKPPRLGETDIAFKFKLKEEIENFEESWHLFDLQLDNAKVINEKVDINEDKDNIDLIVHDTGKQDNKWIFWVDKNKNTPSATETNTQSRAVVDNKVIRDEPNRYTSKPINYPGTTTLNINDEIHRIQL